MFFKINKKELLNSLNVVSRAISNYSPLPAFSGIKFDVSEQEICLMASDSDISIKTYLTINDEFYMEIIKPGSIVIEAKYILDIVRKMDTEIVEIEVLDGCNIKISDESSEFKIIGMYANEYPLIDFDKSEDSFKINSLELKKIINQTIFATSDKDTRPYLNGINFKIEGNNVECTATDSYRLAKTSFTIEKDFSYNIIIPSKSLNELMKSLDEDREIELFLSNKKVQFLIDNTTIQTRLIDGKFPDTQQLIPTSFDYELSLDIRDILGSIDRVSFIKNDGVNIIKLELTSGECILSSKSQEIGSATEILRTATFQGNNLNISFNGRYVFEAIKAINASTIKFKFSGDMKPFIIEGEGIDNVLQLVLPVRTYL
ncbi:DNA polymerase III subunit beta [Breznakia sp. OttesenSCG-928-G09]|nr:DNA polymerase III subunit beta [Breznakia sp. OttesenSCG-928-G09]